MTYKTEGSGIDPNTKSHQLKKHLVEGTNENILYLRGKRLAEASFKNLTIFCELHDVNQDKIHPHLSDEEVKEIYDECIKHQRKSSKKTTNETLNKSISKELEEAHEVLKEKLSDYVYVQKGGIFRKKDNPLEVIPDKEFNRTHLLLFSKIPLKQPITDYVIRYGLVKQVVRTTYTGSNEMFLYRNGEEQMNIWKAPEFAPSNKHPDLFLDHVRYITGSEEQSEMFLDWLSYIIQNPCKKIGYATVIVTRNQGTGKSFFAELNKKLLGEDNLCELENSSISDNFTDWQEHTQMVVIHELHQQKMGVENFLKNKITERGTSIRRPYQSSYRIENTYNFLCFSNHMNALYISNTSRRYLIIGDYDVEKRSNEYYKDLWSLLKNQDELNAIYSYLKNRDLSKFEPNASPPQTDNHKKMVKASRSDFTGWLEDQYRNEKGIFKKDVFSMNNLMESLDEHIPKFLSNTQGKKNKVRSFLEEKGFNKRKIDYYPSKGVRLRGTVYFIRDQENWMSKDDKRIGGYLRLSPMGEHTE